MIKPAIAIRSRILFFVNFRLNFIIDCLQPPDLREKPLRCMRKLRVHLPSPTFANFLAISADGNETVWNRFQDRMQNSEFNNVELLQMEV